jgi:hypothetical protein
MNLGKPVDLTLSSSQRWTKKEKELWSVMDNYLDFLRSITLKQKLTPEMEAQRKKYERAYHKALGVKR